MRLNKSESCNYDDSLLYLHDIKNTLAGIMNLAGNIKRTALLKKNRQTADEIKRAASDCFNMLKFLKDKNADKTYETVNLHDELNLQVNLLSNNKVKIKKNLSAKHLYVYCSRIGLAAAVHNVILNGIQSSCRMAKLHIRTYNKEEMSTERNAKKIFIVIEIKDRGSGIEICNIKKIFDKGFTTKKEGEGIGLYAAAEEIRKLGGDITAENKKKGAVFTIYLPVQC